MTKILRIDASARQDGSVSRALADETIARFDAAEVTTRDLSEGIAHIDATFTAATFTPPEARDAAANASLALSDEIVAEVQAADVIVISMAMYNFSVPSTLKAWIDQLARVGLTFHYTENGPEGLLNGKRAIILAASGGTASGSDYDFASPYLKFVLGFMGITDVTFIMSAGADGVDAAKAEIEALTL